MNLSEALDAALPEIPKSRLSRVHPPRLDPNLIVRDDLLDGEPVVAIMQRGKGNFFRFQPAQWQLAQYFDGIRTYDEIAAQFTADTGALLTGRDVEGFAANLDEADFWYKTPQEKNMAYSARLTAQRNRRAHRKSKINLAHISFSGWDPDRYLTWVDKLAGRYIYSSWSLLAVLVLFAFEAVFFVNRWSLLGPDIPLFFNFTHKSFADIVEFWLLLFGLGFIHETAHGLTCKHYGGEVHSMGLMFLYLTPAFFVDVTETWISATKVQRLATIIAGIWIEMTICGFAMIVWTNTPPGGFLHDFTYKIILITGVAVIVMNLNPLLKLDGYYFLTEMIGVPDLKERSTAFVIGWFQRFILRLPVEVPAIPRRRAPLFVLYAVISGGYSYLLLYAFLRFSWNVTSKLLAEFALLPVGMIAFYMFRGRLRLLRGLLGEVWRRHFVGGAGSGRRVVAWPIAAAVGLLIALFAPIWRIQENAWFVVETPNPATVHAAAPGRVDAVFVREGQAVKAGQPLLRMVSRDVSSLASSAEAARGAARYDAFEAELAGKSIGQAAAGQEAAMRAIGIARDAQKALLVTAPEDGVILTHDPGALLDRQMASGEALLVLAGQPGRDVVRLFLPAGALSRVQPGAEVGLDVPGRFAILRLRLGPIDGEAVSLPPGLVAHQDYKGVILPVLYAARTGLPEGAGDLPLGMAGLAKVYGPRRSLVGRMVSVALNLVRAHVW